MELWGRRLARLIEKVAGRRGVDGFVDRVLAGEVIGWAFDPKKPNRRVHIVARCDGRIVAEALADLPRKDLAQSGKGDGRHGFNLRLPASLFDGAPRKVRIEIGNGPTRRLLKGGAVTVAAKRPAAAAPPPPRPAPCHGMLESIGAGVLHGWAAHPRNGGSAAVVDVYDDERYLGSVTADRPRPGLREAGAPSGALGFQFRLPANLDDVAVSRLRARIAGTRIELRRIEGFPRVATSQGPEDEAAAATPAAKAQPPAPPARAAAGPAPGPQPAAAAQRDIALLIVGDADEARIRKATHAWAAQGWPALAIGAVGPGQAGGGEHRFGPADEAGLRGFLGGAHSVILAGADETFDPGLARAVAVGRPLADVLTWDRSADGPRGDERLAVLLGEPAAALAVRGALLGAYPGQLAAELSAGDPQNLQAWLAETAAARWGRLAGVLSHGPAGPRPIQARRTPPGAPEHLSLAVWPQWSAASRASLDALVAGAPAGCALEVLVPADAPAAEIEAGLRRADGARRISVRPVDGPSGEDAGGWLRALSEAAAGEVVVLCRAGVVLKARDQALAEVSGWALHPLVGPVTVEVSRDDGAPPLAGLVLRQTRAGWTTTSGFAPGLAGRARPILAAPAAFLAIGRAKLAAVGGFDAERFADAGGDIDLALRLRRSGHCGVLLADIGAAADAAPLAAPVPPAALAVLDGGELAASADAFPAPAARPSRNPTDAQE